MTNIEISARAKLLSVAVAACAVKNAGRMIGERKDGAD